MASIVGFSDFKCEAQIPSLIQNVGAADVANNVIQTKVQQYIDKYESKFIDLFFELFEDQKAAFVANVNAVEKNALLTALQNVLKPAIANYVSYWYQRNESVSNSGIGAILKQGENSKRTNNGTRLCKIFNESVDIARKEHLSYFGIMYPKNEIFTHINNFNF